MTLGLLAEIDKAALAGYCQAYGRWHQAERELKRMGIAKPQKEKAANGKMVETGYVYINQWLYVANKAMEQMKWFLAEFGMTPSTRSRIMVGSHEDNLNEYEQWKAKKAKKRQK